MGYNLYNYITCSNDTDLIATLTLIFDGAWVWGRGLNLPCQCPDRCKESSRFPVAVVYRRGWRPGRARFRECWRSGCRLNLKCQHATEDVDAICHSYCTMYCHQRLCALEIHAEKVIRGFPPLYHWRKQLEDVGTHISHVLLWVIVFSYRASMSPEQPWSHLAEIKCQLSFTIASLRQKLDHKL